MDTRLKQRLIGAIVLTTLAIIVLPMLLDGSAEDRARVVARIPEPPGIQLKKMTVADIDHKMQQMQTDSAARMPELEAGVPPATLPVTRSQATPQPATKAASDSKVTADKFALDKDKLPVSWSLQLGSFKNEDNALRLRKELRDHHYRAYVIAAQTDQGKLYRVLVGPMLERDKLEALGQEIESRLKLKGQVVRYRIEDDAGQVGG